MMLMRLLIRPRFQIRMALALLRPVLCLGLSLTGPAPSWAEAGGLGWQQLSSSERAILQPLQPHWSDLDSMRKQKWRDIAARFPQMTPEQQDRARSRMADWSTMSTEDRSAARLRYQESKQLPTTERQAKWERYQSLSEEQRRSLAAKAGSATAPPASGTATRPATRPGSASVSPLSAKTQALSASSVARPVNLGSVQGTSGASTRPISRLPDPPLPQQKPGHPRINATPDKVQSATLLPRRLPAGPDVAGSASVTAHPPVESTSTTP
jgi:hypothetical protein